MPLRPLAVQFAEVADAYERGRPEYAPAVVGAIAAELRIPAAGPVLDLAAGTGKLTRALLNRGAGCRSGRAAAITARRAHRQRRQRTRTAGSG